MGRFFLLVVMVGACGDNLAGGDEADPPLLSPGKPSVQPRYVPAVCGVRAWDMNVPADLNVSAAPLGHGAALLAAPRSGGLLTGFLIDPRMNLSAPTKILIDGAFTSVTASVVDGRIVSTAIGSGAIHLDLLDPDLGNPQYIVSLPGTQLAEPAFYHATTDLVMPVGGDDGVWLYRFADSFEPLDQVQFMTSKPVRSLAAAQLGSAMLIASSTDSECDMAMTSKLAPGRPIRINSPCGQPRIAIDQKTLAGVMVFDGVDGVRMMTIQGAQFASDAPLLRPDTRAPRTTFDGTRFWISYLDPRGDLIVGILDAEWQPITMSLAGPKPDPQAYDMVMINGTPWVLTLGVDGYTAHQMCAVIEGSGSLELSRGRGPNIDPLL